MTYLTILAMPEIQELTIVQRINSLISRYGDQNIFDLCFNYGYLYHNCYYPYSVIIFDNVIRAQVSRKNNNDNNMIFECYIYLSPYYFKSLSQNSIGL